MGTLNITFAGVSAYVPHEDGTALMVVMPNGTHLGDSPTTARDRTPLASHLPLFWEEFFPDPVTRAVTMPRPFLGDRLTFEFCWDPGPAALQNLAFETDDWLMIDAAAVGEHPDDRVAAQVLVRNGTAAVISGPEMECDQRWYSHWDIEQHILRVEFCFDNVHRVRVLRQSLIGLAHEDPVLHERALGPEDEVTFRLGNLCAETVLEWPGNYEERRNGEIHRAHDVDFKWIYRLATNPEVDELLSKGETLPVPDVKGPTIGPHDSAFTAFDAAVHGGGGLTGCLCGGKKCKPMVFPK